MDLTLFLLSVITLIVSIILYISHRRTNYWKNRGIPHDKPHFFFGNMTGVTRTRPQFMAVNEIYNKYKGTGPFCGFYFFLKPAVLVLDLELAKKVLIKDFQNFDERGIFHNGKNDPLSANLFAIDGASWRPLRQKLSPTFTSGKIKFMFPTVVEVGHRFAQTFGETLKENSVIEIKDILARFTTDVIVTCALGIECNSLKDPNAQFRVMGRKIFGSRRHFPLVIAFMQSCPNLARKLRMQLTRDDVEEFFMRAVRETVEFREKHNIERNDFMSLLISLKNNDPTTIEGKEEFEGLTMNEIAAQAFVFYLGGFETSSSTMSFALYELARHQDIQDRLRREVNDVLAKHNGELTYESMKEMHYMDQVISETLRMYSVVTFLFRRAKENYYTSDPKYYIQKGAMVIIPSVSIHNDRDYYPNPEQFDPERFTLEEIQKRDAITWLPFGDGPRNCIGLRFGKMQTRIGLALLIRRFKFTICEKTEIPIQYDLKSLILQAKNGIYLRAETI